MLQTEKQIREFYNRVIKTDSCWIWNGTKSSDGYGKLGRNGKTIRAHRYSYMINGRELIDGLVLDHLCKNTLCVNPSHLEQVTVGENQRRGYRTKLKLEDIEAIRKLYKEGIKQKEISLIYGVKVSMISRIINFVKWK